MDAKREVSGAGDNNTAEQQQDEVRIIRGANGYLAIISGDTENVLIEGCDSSVCDEVICIKDRLLAGQEITQEDVEFCKDGEARSYFTDDEIAELARRADESS